MRSYGYWKKHMQDGMIYLYAYVSRYPPQNNNNMDKSWLLFSTPSVFLIFLFSPSLCSNGLVSCKIFTGNHGFLRCAPLRFQKHLRPWTLDMPRTWYEKAALMGHCDAQNHLSLLLRDGHVDQSLHWLRLAAKSGSATAQCPGDAGSCPWCGKTNHKHRI